MSNPNEKEQLEPPPGFTSEQLAWLAAWVEAESVTHDSGGEWLQRDRLESAVQAMTTEVPRLAAQWLPACLGLVRLADQVGYPDLRAAAQVAAGKLCWVCARYQEALAMFEQARSTFEALNDRTQTAVCYRSAGAVYHQMGLPGEARAMYQQATALFEELKDGRNAAICYFNTGLVEFQTGHPDKALQMYAQAQALFEQVGDFQSSAVCLLNIGIVYADLGRAAEALSMYERARAVFEELEDRRRTATCFHQAGLLYSRMGHLSEALVMYDKARALFEELGDRRRVALCFLNAANHVYSRQGHFAHAEAMYDRARPIFEELQDRRGVAGCYLNAGDALLLEGKWQEAQGLYEQARAIFEEIEDVVSLAHCYSSEGETWVRRDEPEKAKAFYERAYHLLESSGDVRSLILCHQRQGDLHQKLGSNEQAADCYECALSLLESLRDTLPDPEMAVGAAFNFEQLPASLAAMLIRLNRPEDAFTAAQRGKGALLRYAALGMRAKREILLSDEQVRLRELRADYEQKRETLSQTPAQSPEYRKLYHAMETALAELNAYEMALRSRNEIERPAEVPQVNLEEIAVTLGPERAILEILVDDRQICLLLLKTRQGKPVLKSHLTMIDHTELQALVNEWHETLRQNGEPSRVQALSERLYQSLIAPFEMDLEGIKTLILCPDHFLHAVPFPALRNPEGQYLIEKFSLVTGPSASAWEACCQANARLQSMPSDDPLIVAVSRFGHSSPQPAGLTGLTDLPHVLEEAETVHLLLGHQAQVLIDKQATVQEVSRCMPQSGLLHFATHAFPNATASLMGALALAPGSAPTHADLLYARDIYEMDLKASLTVLSACSTTQGRIAGGEGLIGLAWAFLMAGCPSVIATRWEAQDEAARLWVESFYRAYVAGCSKAESARRACRHLIKLPVFSAPHFWAGWTLIGNDV
jgi:CHAT domain-containing protein